MKVKELMSTNITCACETTPALHLAAQMKRNNIGSVPVCDDAGHIKGIVTDRDLVLRALGKDASIEEITAGDIMTLNPVTVSPESGIHEAALLFSAYQIRRLPVMEASRIVGMLSLGDIASKPVYIDEAGDALSAISLTAGLQSGN